MRVVVADDLRLLLEGTQVLLEPVADIEVVGVTHEGERVLALVAELGPDVLLLDSEMPGVDTLALLDTLHTAHPGVAVVLLAEEHDPELVTAARKRGAKGVFLKSEDPDALVPALRSAYRGEIRSPESPAAPRASAHGLTQREEDVLVAMARGLTNPQIAHELSIARPTVKFHLRNAYGKLGVASRLEALRVVVEEALFGTQYNWLK